MSNAQTKLIALYDLDVSWILSDVG